MIFLIIVLEIGINWLYSLMELVITSFANSK